MKNKRNLLFTIVLVIVLAGALTCEGPVGPQETVNERGEGLEATVDAVASFFELDSTARAQTVADVAMFLRLDDIPGESTDEAHKGDLDVLGIELGRAVRVIRAPNDRVAGESVLSDIVCIREVDKSSPLLEKAAASGKVFPTATLSIRKTGYEGQVEYYLTIEMEDITIESYQKGGLENPKTEEVAMTVAKYHFTQGWPSKKSKK